MWCQPDGWSRWRFREVVPVSAGDHVSFTVLSRWGLLLSRPRSPRKGARWVRMVFTLHADTVALGLGASSPETYTLDQLCQDLEACWAEVAPPRGIVLVWGHSIVS